MVYLFFKSQAGKRIDGVKDTILQKQAELVLRILPDILAKGVRHARQKG